MITGTLAQLQQSYSLKAPEIPTKSADRTGDILPPRSSGEKADISDAGRLALEREIQNIAEARDNNEFIDLRGHAGNIRLGLIAMGQSTMDSWSAKGLELNEESILAAGEAFQKAFRINQEKNGSSTAGSSISLNRHQIVINSQAVPDWLVEEYENAFSLMDDSEVKTAFKNGETFYVSQPLRSNSEALSRYSPVQSSI